MLDADPADLLATAAAQPHDPGFVPFVRRAQAAGIPVEVVSDGFGFFIEPALAGARGRGAAGRHGPDHLRRPAGRRSPTRTATRRCFVCGTCKRQRVLAPPGRRPAVVFIGDGESDRYAAGYSDVVFAKRSLVRICVEAGWPFQRWTEFSEIDAWLADDRRRVAGRPGVAAAARSAPPFFCGPEVWGEGLEDPPPDAWPPTGPAA